MEKDFQSYFIPDPTDTLAYSAPGICYCKTKAEFDFEAGMDFIRDANNTTKSGEAFLVGLSHGQSPSGVYEFLLDHFDELQRPDLIYFTFVNSKLKRQRQLTGVRDAISFIKELLNSNKISKDKILGSSLNRDFIEEYNRGINQLLKNVLSKFNKQGLDYAILASNPKGQVAGITRNSKAFDSDEPVVIVNDEEDLELTFTPSFLKKTKRIAFLATKSEKRRPLAWLFYKWGKPDESPSFLRFIEDVETRMKVFIDDNALTWPQVEITRNTGYGNTSIRVDMALPYDINKEKKKPVVLMVHGFLGLNTFDGLLAFIPSAKYLAAAIHYGSIPEGLPVDEYSQFVVENIDATVSYFGSRGHPVYIFDHSMANIYGLMMDRGIENLQGIKKYLKGRIASNPFFGEEAKHSATGFIDNVVLKSGISFFDKLIFQSVQTFLPFETKNGARKTGIKLTEWLITMETGIHERIWKAIKERILSLVNELETIPAMNRVPLEHTLNRLPVKIFAIQIHSALKESVTFDEQESPGGFIKYRIPVLVLKSDRDPVAKFVSRIYKTNALTQIIETTNVSETDVFKEHLFYMIHPKTTINIIDRFILEITGDMHKIL